MKNSVTITIIGACIAALVPSGAYAATPASRDAQTEATLSAAGFRSIPDTSPEVAQIIATTPLFKLHAEPAGNEFNYVFVDPQGCGCVLEGNEAAYQQYQELNLEHQTAELNSTAAYGRLDPPGAFGGWGWDASYAYGPFAYGYGYGYEPFGFSHTWYRGSGTEMHHEGGRR